MTPSNPFDRFERDRSFRLLSDLMRSGRPPLALVGAGASINSGYPSWSGLLEAMWAETSLETKAAQWKTRLDGITDAPWIAELFARGLRRGDFVAFIRKHFGGRGRLAEPHLTLARMPFRHFLTTNYDPCVEEALAQVGSKPVVVDWCDAEAVSRFLIRVGEPESPRHVVYLHGRFDSPEKQIILTESSYVARYITSDDARRKLMAIFMTQPVVFVGFSMNDPDLANLMREVTARLRSRRPSHFAIMSYKSESEREAIRARMEGKFGVSPVFYSRVTAAAGGDEHENLCGLLDALMGRSATTDRADRRRGEAASPAAASDYDPEDPNSGRFGRASATTTRRVSVKRRRAGDRPGILGLTLAVETLSGDPLTGPVEFHLHPSFHPRVEVAQAEGGRAGLEIEAYGAFTLGVVADGGSTRLELDLAAEPKLPLWFRRR